MRLPDGRQSAFDCRDGDTVLAAMERCGNRSIPVGCRGGGCGTCRVRVVAGRYRCGKMSALHVDGAAAAAGFALACRLVAEDDLVIELASGGGRPHVASDNPRQFV
ncbi:MAG TPA: 2Fe-2S iron-sulfur cluster-binding protein [Alphaproteobacteria bacterium]|nr:2Fe-2S iron-sulfur cluster-binding protein [Alphaproteobacteria bacterium]